MSERFTRKLLHPEKVSDLLAEHATAVAAVLEKARAAVEQRPELAEAARRVVVDELFALRYVLSAKHGSVDQAVQNVVETLEWRSQRLEALEDAIVRGKIKGKDVAAKHSYAGYVGLLDDRHPVFVIRAGKTNLKGLLGEMSVEDIMESNLLQSAQLFHICDQKTRETGLLCKQIAILDLDGFSLFNYDSRFGRATAKVSHLSATYFPQLLGKTVIINMPQAFRIIYKGMSLIMPASTLEKQAVCPGKPSKHSASECPFLKKFKNGVEILPPFLGGTGPMIPYLTIPEKEQ